MNALDIVAAIIAGIMFIAGCALDSVNPAPLIVCGFCLVWLVFYIFVRGYR